MNHNHSSIDQIQSWRMGQLGEAVSLVRRWTQLEEDAQYKRVTVQLHGRGLYLRDEVNGHQVRTKKQQVVKKGDLLVAEIDAKMGAFGLVPPELDGAVVSSHYFTFVVDSDAINPGYLSLLITVGHLTNEIQSAVRGSLNYAAIRPHHVLTINIPFPPLHEQQRLASQAIKAQQAKQAALEQVQALEDLPKVLFHHAIRKAFTETNGTESKKAKTDFAPST